jgi:two-component system, OmpR family, phosphate regulon response regulator PhoB
LDRIHISAAQSAIEVPKGSPAHVLLIAQDVAVAKGVCADLDAAGLRCTFVRTCAHARKFIIRQGVDLILLDRMVLATAGDCWSELRRHQETRPVPILAFSQQADASNVAAQAKTFTAAGIGPVPGRLQGHGIILDRIAQRVSYEGQETYLPYAAFRLLEYFLRHPGRVISRGELFASLWGQHDPVGRRIDVYVGSLRKLLRRQNGGTLIQTVRGVGYVFTDQRADGRLSLRRVDGNEDPRHDAAAFRPQGDQFKLDHKGRCLQINGVGFHLSPREFAVLELLMLNPNLTLSRSVIAGCIWGQGEADPRTVDATISRLRKAIHQQSTSNRPICSVPGKGYQFRT